MKKSFLIILITTFIVASCTSSKSELIIGKWKAVSYEHNGPSDDFFPGEMEAEMLGYSVTFTLGGKIIQEHYPNQMLEGKWKLKDDDLYIRFVTSLSPKTGHENTIEMWYKIKSINSQELILIDDAGSTTTFKKQ